MRFRNSVQPFLSLLLAAFFIGAALAGKTYENYEKAEKIFISEIDSRGNCYDGSRYFEVFNGNEFAYDVAKWSLVGVDVSAGETETVFTFGDFSKPVYPGETRLIGTSEGCGDFYHAEPPREDAITSGRNYKLLDEKGEVIDETGIVPETTDATHTWQRMKVWDGEPKVKFKVTEFSDSFGFYPATAGRYNSQNTIVLNEFSTRTNDGYCGGSGDFVEIANAGAVTVDISGYGIAEKDADFDDDKLYAFPAGSSLAAGARITICAKNDTHDGLDFGLSLEEGVTLYDSNGFVIDTFFASDHSQHVDGRSIQRVPDIVGRLAVATPSTPNQPNFVQSILSEPSNEVPELSGSSSQYCCFHIRTLGMHPSFVSNAGMTKEDYSVMHLVNEPVTLNIRIPVAIPTSAGSGFADNALFDFKLVSYEDAYEIPFPQSTWNPNLYEDNAVRFLPGMTEVNITVVPKRMTKEAAVTDTPSSTEDYNPSDRLWLEADLDGGGLAGEDTWNTYQVWRYGGEASKSSDMARWSHKPFELKVRKKKLYQPTIVGSTSVIPNTIDQMVTYIVAINTEGLPSNRSLGIAETVTVNATTGETFSEWNTETTKVQLDLVGTGLVFGTLTGSTTDQLTLSSTSTTSEYRVYATELGTIPFNAWLKMGTAGFEEYMLDPDLSTSDVSVFVRCQNNFFPVFELARSTCQPCPMGTNTLSNSSATNEMDCVCSSGMVDLRRPGMLPDHVTFLASASLSPCVDAMAYCDNPYGHTIKECVTFDDGKPVAINPDWYRWNFDNWTWVRNDGSQDELIISTKDQINQFLTPYLTAKSCEEDDICILNATGTEGNGCDDGAYGPLCGSCKAGYFWNQDNLVCDKCKRGRVSGQVSTELIIVSAIFLTLLGLMLYTFIPVQEKMEDLDEFRRTVRREYRTRFDIFKEDVRTGEKRLNYIPRQTSLKGRLESGPKLPNTWRYKIGSRCWELEDSCRTKVKILVGFCQILVLWPKQILSVRWPDVFVEMTETLKLFSLDFRLLPLDCLFRRDFYSKFIVATCSPLILLGGVWLGFFLRGFWIRNVRRMMGYATKISLLMAFLVYPSLSGIVLQFFSCKDVGLGNEFMRYSIQTSCETEKYDEFLAAAWIFVFAFPIGIPLAFFSLIYRGTRDAVRAHDNKTYFLEHEDSIRRNRQLYGWIYRDYKAEYWMWEIIDMVKKFLLGCAVIFVDPGSDTQLYVAIFIATGFLLLLAVVNPYEKVQDNICAQLSHFSLAAIATFALMIKNEVCEKDGWKCEIVDYSMLFTVLFVLIASIGLAVSEALYQRRSKADFIRYDADLSGDLDRNEIKQLLTDLRIDNSDESISKIFARFDKDHSDSIDFEEFIECGVWLHGLTRKKDSARGVFRSLKKTMTFRNP